MSELVVPVLLTIITASTPLVFAAAGEVVVEKSGVLNLGVEGMMIVGAVVAFAVGVKTESATLAILSGATGGMLTAFIFGFLTFLFFTIFNVWIRSNPVHLYRRRGRYYHCLSFWSGDYQFYCS